MVRALVVAALAASFACKERDGTGSAPEPPQSVPPPAAPERVQEVEPNDFQRAQQIPPRAIVSGSIAGPRDDDWYRISAGTNVTLALRVELSGVDAGLEIYDRDRNRIARAAGVIPGAACVEACFIKVSGSAPGKYELTVTGGAPRPGEELEPNDRAVDATPLEAGKPMQGSFLTPEDEDWYRLVLPQPQPGQYLRIEVAGVEGVRPELEVRSIRDGVLLASMRAGAAGEGLFVRDLSTRLDPLREAPDAGVEVDGGEPDGAVAEASDAGAVPPGGYYLVLKSAPVGKGRGANPRVPYTLTATLDTGPADLEVEPNDDPPHATALLATATGYLAPVGDQDWYRVHADVPSVLHAELTGIERADLELSVHSVKPNEKPVLLARANEGGWKEGEVLPSVGIPAGDAYILVQSAQRNLDGKWVRDGEDRQNPYRLQISLAPDDGSTDREPNNDVASAQPIALPATVKGWIWPKKDVDLFRFHVDAGRAPVSIRLSAVRGVDTMLRLLELRGEKGEVIGSADAVRGEGEEQILSVPLKEGDYAVEVSSPKGKDASATQSYQLTVR